ncbi:uncharacterized protein LOC100902100 [Galendromus occidentalis]|uniref:Uncharacterized protein LOC100902100 n=1 Tax=Galendromus occidentalis TaxID=34638 RepID=A0AAJ6QMZ7_9ACAR|nr:uncharacterized protein LOC100902100 [Galendromus occidentalis]
MPREKATPGSRLNLYVRYFGGDILTTDGSVLFCKICEKNINGDKKYFVRQHINSASHTKRTTRDDDASKKQVSLLPNFVTRPQKGSEFNMDLCETLVKADIPFYKIQNPCFRRFIEKWSKQYFPHESALRKTYLKEVYDGTIRMIRASIGEGKIWVSVDETTDSRGLFVVNTVVGKLSASEPSTAYLLGSEIVERTNHATIAQAFCNSLSILWPEGIKHERVLLFVTDGAKYMKKAADGLKVLFPNMVYVTCLAHGIHRVCEEIRKLCPETDSFIASVKKCFLKAPSRIQKFRDLAPNLPLPPSPVVTRWGTWLEAASYLAANYDKIEEIVNSFEKGEALYIFKSQEMLRNPALKNQLLFVSANYRNIPDGIRRLECTAQSLETTCGIVEDIGFCLERATGPKAGLIKAKFETVLNKNQGYSTLRDILSALRGDGEVMALGNFDLPDLALYRYAPMVSVDVERSFSRYKMLLSDRRQSFTPENAMYHIVSLCNNTDE